MSIKTECLAKCSSSWLNVSDWQIWINNYWCTIIQGSHKEQNICISLTLQRLIHEIMGTRSYRQFLLYLVYRQPACCLYTAIHPTRQYHLQIISNPFVEKTSKGKSLYAVNWKSYLYLTTGPTLQWKVIKYSSISGVHKDAMREC